MVMRFPPDERQRRPAIVIALHWFSLAALLLGVLVILLREEIDSRALRHWLLEAHRHFGLLVFGLLLARLAVRLARHRLPAVISSSRLVHAAAVAMHLTLYLLLACVPLLGWISSNARGQDMRFLGIALPTLLDADDDLADTLTQWHVGVAWTLLALGLAHAMAALWHHCIRRDQVLVAMLPQWHGRRARTKDRSFL